MEVKTLILLFFLIFPYPGSAFLHRSNFEVSSRNIVYRDPANPDKEYDTITVDNYLRNYMRGPINDEVAFYNHDLLAAYVGPAPLHDGGYNVKPTLGSTHPITVRGWTMFDLQSGEMCDLNAIHDYGELALFSCPKAGIYRAYATEFQLAGVIAEPTLVESKIPGKPTLSWRTKEQMDLFNIALSQDESLLQHLNMQQANTTLLERMEHIHSFEKKVTSDPVIVKGSYYCYYWMFNMREVARVGYLGKEVIPPTAPEDKSYILIELLIWVAEPTALNLQETDGHIGTLVVSEYSRVITNRFYDTGLFPCLRKAHRVIEVVSEIQYISETDQSNPLNGAPHWLAVLKVHTDRLISTLSDVTFTIASRQNTGSFHCFVGDTKVYLAAREFDFVPHGKLERGTINLEVSKIWYKNKISVKHQFKHVYGHGVQFSGHRHTKIFQPSTNRTDMVVFPNACIAQEFAFSVSGSFYVAEGFLRRGVQQATKVFLPDFSSSHGIKTNPKEYRGYLRIADAVFTPVHLAILMSDGSIILHPTSAALKGMGRARDTHKYRPTSFVRRRWCPRTSTPKFSGMMLPVFSEEGNIIILHVYSIEGSVRMWVTPPSTSCVVEGLPLPVAEATASDILINETDIHYEDFQKVKRTNHKTGLLEPTPPDRPPPPERPVKNIEELDSYLLNEGKLVVEGEDPHYPPELIDPARTRIGSNLDKYNEAVIYVLERERQGLQRLLDKNGFTNVPATSTSGDVGLYSVEFAAIEKQFIAAVKFKAREVPQEFSEGGENPFQMMVTTVTVTNFPFRVKLQLNDRDTDEELDTVIPFPGTILVRSKHFKVPVVPSLDLEEAGEHEQYLKGNTEIEFIPQLFMMNTAIPSYVINFGDILVYTSLESRYARPLHYYDWEAIDKVATENSQPQLTEKRPLNFSESTISFNRKDRLYDAVVTDQGIISVLWRKAKRHLIKETPEGSTEDETSGYTQTVAMGSVISLEGLREVKPFFRHDNVFQRSTPDGEVIYGIYDVKPHSPFETCRGSWNLTAKYPEACIQVAESNTTTNGTNQNSTSTTELPFCAKNVPAPCRSLIGHGADSGIPICDGPTDERTCLRLNQLAEQLEDSGNTSKVTAEQLWPDHAPFEELRSVNLLGTSFLSYLLGSLQSVKSLHPEASTLNITDEDGTEHKHLDSIGEEPDICPFSSFKVYNQDFDFAEVGYQTRITGEISYFGTGIPTEADLIVEFDSIMGVIVDVSSSVEEQRGLTTIKKTIDISFKMTDFILGEILTPDVSDENALNLQRLDFDDIRAREKSNVFSVTIRPSVVNNHCKSTDYFKTVQFNVGCNTFSTMRLIAEATPFTRRNWTAEEQKQDSSGSGDNLKWEKNGTTLLIPKSYVFHKQVKANVFDCFETETEVDGKTQFRSQCVIPHFNLFGDDIFTVSYRDFFYPKFEQFLTVSARPVTGNVVIYDLMGSMEFNLTTNNLQAGCHSSGDFWYEKLVNSTSYLNKGASEHENVYKYFVNCYNEDETITREASHQLSASTFYLHNLTNNNRIKFKRQRNQIFVFRAVVVNTVYNRFTYCKTLESFFMVRVVGIPIPRQGLALWNYLVIVFIVVMGLVISYLVFFKFYTWKLDAVATMTTETVD